MQKQYYIASIIIWLGGLCLLASVDYVIRLFADNYYSLGMNETVWFLLQTLIGITSLGMLFKAVKQMPTHKAILLFGTTVIIGMLVYLLMTWLYVLGTGVDSI